MAAGRRTVEGSRELRASLVAAAQRLVAREGAGALTMRGLAAEAGCAVGLPYKVFTSRDDLVVEVIVAELVRLRDEFEALVADAGQRTVGENLGRYARTLLASPAVGLARDIVHDDELTATIDERAGQIGIVAALETTVADYLAAEKRLGRIDPDVDAEAFGFVVAGAVHNLIVSGEAYPRPSQRRLEQMLAAVADRLAPRPHRQPRPPASPSQEASHDDH
jgi:AcrR family transcriptional regulator